MRLSIPVAVLLLYGALATPTSAAPVTFRFESSLDASDIGGPAASSFVALYTFDDAALNGSGLPDEGIYGPVSIDLDVGGQTLTGLEGQIFLFDTVAGQDFFEVVSTVAPAGSLFGWEVLFFGLNLADDDGDLLAGVALPTDPGFAERAEYASFGLFLVKAGEPGEGGGFAAIRGDGVDFTLTRVDSVVPEPASLAMLGIGGVALLGMRFGRR